MTPEEAYKELKEMDCINENGSGYFTIEKYPPSKNIRELDLFVKCIKTLGSWSVVTEWSAPQVDVTCGHRPDQLLFRVHGRE